MNVERILNKKATVYGAISAARKKHGFRKYYTGAKNGLYKALQPFYNLAFK